MTQVKSELEAVKIEVKEQAQRHNTGKPQLSYVPLDCFTECARVFEYGAVKYGERDNWRKGQELEQILDSLLRHIAAIQAGEELDKESGLHHIGHIQCNAAFLGLWLKNKKEK